MNIDKLAWIYIENKKALFVCSKGKDTYYNPGGKREKGENDEVALIREIKEELDVDLIPGTIKYLNTFSAQAHGKPKGVIVSLKCFLADFQGNLKPSSEIEKMSWLDSSDLDKTSETGKMSLKYLKEQNLID